MSPTIGAVQPTCLEISTKWQPVTSQPQRQLLLLLREYASHSRSSGTR